MIRLIPLLLAGILTAAEPVSRTQLIVVDQDLVLLNGTQATGQIVGETDDSIEFLALGRSEPQRYPKTALRIIQRRQTAAAAATRRGREALAANDIPDAEQAVRWARERGADDAALAVARQILERGASVTAADAAADILAARGEDDAVRALCEQVLARDPRWQRGYAELVRIHRAAGATDQVRALVERWLALSPTAPEANRVRAALAEQDGDRKAAQDAYGRLWRLHKDLDAAAKVAWIALLRGERAEAAKAAQALVDAGRGGALTAAVLGTAAAMDGDAERARPLLEQALAEQPDAQVALLARHNLGVLAARAGDAAAAIAHLRACDHPVSRFALATIEHRPFAETAALPEALRAQAAFLTTAVHIEQRRFAEAARQPDDLSTQEGRFMALVTAMLKEPRPSEEAVRRLEGFTGEESLRWQAYGHLLAQRWETSERILGRLRADDGYAACYRVFAAAGRRDAVRARELFAQVQAARNPPAPAAYAARLAGEYEAADSDRIIDGFDWPPGQVATGWQIEPAAGVSIAAADGVLAARGRQRGPGMAWAWRLVQADRLRRAELALDPPKSGRLGLVLADEARREGVVVAVEGGQIQWAALAAQGQLAWKRVRPHPAGGRLVVVLSGGRAVLSDPEDPSKETALDARLPPSGLMTVGIVAEGPADGQVDAAADELLLHLRTK
ncbi:MAG: hypothetical protein RLZZ127_869 [Planctomycetota bacterium]|jgi:tetratricopeptide (TPR) repeat protein